MLTAYQCATGAYMTEDGELYCATCYNAGGIFGEPVSNYGLDEWQLSSNEGYDWIEADDYVHEGCMLAVLCDGCGSELVDEWHEDDCKYPNEDQDPNPPAPRWTPCSSCHAGDGEPHRPGCSTLKGGEA